MDPISAIIVAAAVVSFITSTSALVSSTALIYERSAESAPMLDRVSRELEIFSQIMRDVEGVLAEGGSVLDPGSGLMVALKNTCSEVRNKFYYVADILERFLRERRGRTLFSSLRVAFLFINRRDDLMFHYQSLRDSASLARDLASDVKVEILLARVDARFNERLVDIDTRINYQLSQLTGSMATLLSDEDDENNGQHNETDGQPTTGNSGDTNVPPRGGDRGGFRKMARIGRQMVELSETGFTRSITLIIDALEDSNGKEPVSRQKEVKILGKLDTASDANLVSYDMLIDEGLQEKLLIPIPVEKRIELHGLEGAKCTPEWEVTLHWYKAKDMKRRKDRFLVIKNAPFEVLFSSDSSFKQLSDRSVLLSLERFKPKKEVLAEIKAEEENRKKALERVEKEYREAEALKRVPARRHTGIATSSA